MLRRASTRHFVIPRLAVVSALMALASPTPAHLGAQEWASVSLDPVFQIGVSEELFRVADLELDGEGVFVIDGGSQRVLQYSMEGVLEGSFGREGEGPGEFQNLATVTLCAGLLIGWDLRLDRVTVLDELVLAATFQLSPIHDKLPLRVDCMASDLLVTYGGWGPDDVSPGPYRPNFTLHRFSLEGDHLERLAEIPGDERYRFPAGDIRREFGVKTVVLPIQNSVFYGTGAAFEIRELGGDGAREGRTFRLHGDERVPVMPWDIQSRQEGQLAAVAKYGPSVVAELRRNQRLYEYPSLFPPYEEMLSDHSGNLWVQRYMKPDQDFELWEVFSLVGGNHLGSISMPARFQLMDVREGRVAGVWRDELDVEFVRVYEIQ